MSNPVLVLGLVCIVAAIVGGGLTAFGIEVPALQSRGRQVILAVFGLLVVAATYTQDLAAHLEAACKESSVPCLSVLQPIVNLFQSYIGTASKPPTPVPKAADVQIKLTGFNGMWRGSGTDQSWLFDKQGASCKTTIQSDLSHLLSNTVCDGQEGLHKVIDLSVTLDGDQFTGTLTQSASVRRSAASVLRGSVSGHKTEDTAVFQVQFPGWLPSATVNLKLNSPSSYSMHVTRLGLPVMEVVFNRIDQP
jgi:hypothetical protein